MLALHPGFTLLFHMMKSDVYLWSQGEPGLAEVPSVDYGLACGAKCAAAAAPQGGAPLAFGALPGGVGIARAACSGPGKDTFPGPVLLCGPCSSALDVVWRVARLGEWPAWGSVLAQSQWSGRGQLRRPWLSPQGNVYAALHWPETPPQLAPDMAPLLVALALVLALEDLGCSARIKWPNDIILDDAKAGGILLEQRGSTTVAGIGLNILPVDAQSVVRTPGAPPVGNLPLSGEPVEIWRQCLSRMARLYDTVIREAPARATVELVESRLAWKGRPVRVREAGGPDWGFDKPVPIIVGISVSGGLRLAVGGQEHVLLSGSVERTAQG